MGDATRLGVPPDAEDRLVVLVLGKSDFQIHGLETKLQFVRRKAVVANYNNAQPGHGLGGSNQPPGMSSTPDPKSDEEITNIMKAIQGNANLSKFVSFTEEQLQNLALGARRWKLNQGEIIIRENDLFADHFYVVEHGVFSFEKAGKQVGVPQENGTSFGELALLYHQPRACTVCCESREGGSLWVISRDLFKEEIARGGDHKVAEHLSLIDNIETFHCLLADEKKKLAESLVELSFEKHEVITKEGDVGELFYILKSGTLTIFKGQDEMMNNSGGGGGGSGHSTAAATTPDAAATAGGGEGGAAWGGAMRCNTVMHDPQKPYWFGERSILRDEPRNATVMAATADVKVLALSKKQFQVILQPLLDLVCDIGFVSRKTEDPKTFRNLESVQLTDLKKIGLLGCGGFGAVTLEQHVSSGKTYALKALSKGYVVRMKMQRGVLREKEILSICTSAFIIRLYATFNTQESLYFLLEPALGGELFAVYHRHRFHRSITKGRFYSASVVFAFEHLHERNVLYRDLKPENLLLEARGFCKLTDMGLAKIVTGKTYTTCGTPDYFAPEVVKQVGMTKAVDWWTLGVLIHELLSGHAPFEASDQMETYHNIVRGTDKVNFSSYKDRDPDAVDMVRALLKDQPNERLPMKGLRGLRLHRWYHRFDWEALYHFTMRPPHIPTVRSLTDLGNFRTQEGDQPPSVPYTDTQDGWDKDF